MLVDPALLQRIEDAIAIERSAFADGMAAFRPASGARWLPVAWGRAIFTGVHGFSNRALAMGCTARSAAATSSASKPSMLHVAWPRRLRLPRWWTGP